MKKIISIFLLFLLNVSPVGAVITYDSGSQGYTGAATSVTRSHAFSGSDNPILITDVGSTKTTSGVTWNGSAMTRVLTQGVDAQGYYEYLFYAVGTAGTHNIVISLSSSGGIEDNSSGFLGALQTQDPVATSYTWLTSTNHPTKTITTSVDNSMCYMVMQNSVTASAVMDAGTTSAANCQQGGKYCIYSTNVISPAGNCTLGYSTAPSADVVHVQSFIIKPLASSSITCPHTFDGIYNPSTYNGLNVTAASVINGLPCSQP